MPSTTKRGHRSSTAKRWHDYRRRRQAFPNPEGLVKLNRLGFIACGPWGAAFLQDSNLLKNCALEIILTADSGSGNQFAGLFQTAAVCFYSSKESYAVFADKELDAILMAGWPHRIPASFIASIPCPLVNIHASLLPKYRGPEPVIQQLLHNEPRGGVTLHRINQNFDAGPICVQAGFSIEPNDDNRTLFFKAARAGKRAVGVFLEKLRWHELTFSPQDESEASYYPRLNVMDFVIDEASSRAEVLRISRAFRGQYPLVCNLQNQKLFLFEFKFCDHFDAAKRMIRLQDGFLELLKYAPVGIPARSSPRDSESRSVARSNKSECSDGSE